METTFKVMGGNRKRACDACGKKRSVLRSVNKKVKGKVREYWVCQHGCDSKED